MAIPAGPYPAAIDYADIAPGMDIETTTVWPATGASTVTRGTVAAVSDKSVTFTNGATVATEHWVDPPGATITYQMMSAPPTSIPEPAQGTILTDETGAAWQRTADAWHSINGDTLVWADLVAAHPTYTLLQDEPAVSLPDPPPSGYPVTITPDDARLGMDIRVTATYAAGGKKVARAICTWNQDNGADKTDTTPDYLLLNIATGDAWQYNPIADGQTLLVEQMQPWTADSVWDISGIPEPPVGAVVRSRDGIAWQRTGDATEDGPVIDGGGPWVLAGQGMWSSVAGDYPRSFLWLWGAAAPFIEQETAA